MCSFCWITRTRSQGLRLLARICRSICMCRDLSRLRLNSQFCRKLVYIRRILKSHPHNSTQSPMDWWQRRDVMKLKLKAGPVLCSLRGVTLSSSSVPWLQSSLWAPVMLQWALPVSAQVLFVWSPEALSTMLATWRVFFVFSSGLVLHGFAKRFGSFCFVRMLGRHQWRDINDAAVCREALHVH